MYVLFLNKFYFDEIYSFYIVQPTLRFVSWLWREVDVGGINRLIHGIATTSVRVARWMWRVVDVRGIDRLIHGLSMTAVLFARWMWRVVDVRGIDRAVVESGTQGVGLARWLWEAVEVRRIEKASDQIGRAADASGKRLNDVEPRTIQHHLIVLIGWLVVAMLFFYWFVYMTNAL
jgi:hypothetical protein